MKITKRILIMLAAILLALSFAACDEDEPLKRSDGTKSPSVSTGDQTPTGGAQGIKDGDGLSFQAILMYAETGNTDYFKPRALNPSEQAQLRASVEKDGGKVTFGADGSINITGDGKTRLTVYPDGSVEGVDDEGNPFGFSKTKSWPDSAFGKAVPKNDFDISMVVEDDEELMIMFEGVTYDMAKSYGKKLASSGFTVDSNEIDMKDSGMYGYSGKNSADIVAEFNFMSSGGSVTCALSVAKYKEPSLTETGGDDPYGHGSGEETDLPEKFAFLLPDGKGTFDVLQYDGFVAIEKKNGSLSEAKNFASLCAANGYEERANQQYTGDDGSECYFGGYVKDNLEIHISLNIGGKGLRVDLIETEQGGYTPPAGTDEWPASGPLTRIPKPDFGTGFTVVDYGDQTNVSVSGGKPDDFDGYVSKLKAKGFKNHIEYEVDDDVMLFSAYDSDNYAVFVQYAYNVFAIGVTNQPEEEYDD